MIFFRSRVMDNANFLKEMLFIKIPNGKKKSNGRKVPPGIYGLGKESMSSLSPTENK